jgi:hypothetical protein
VATHGGGMYSNKIFTPNGIAEINKEKEKIMVQPNPFSTEINIIFYSMTSENKTIKISDVTGKIVFEKEVKSTAGENFLAIPNLSELNNGAYFLQIGNTTKVLLKK